MQQALRKLVALVALICLCGTAEAEASAIFKKWRAKRKKSAKTEQVATPKQAAEEAVVANTDTLPESQKLTQLSEPAPEPRRDLNPAQYDSLLAEWTKRRSKESFESYFNDFINIDATQTAAADTTPDSLYIRRLRDLASPIELPYNYVVKASIARYTDTRYGLMSRVLGLSRIYFPMIEEELMKAGLPIELRAMAIIESALQITAVSNAGAAGLWQFMPSTGKVYGLEINSLVDERLDPVKSTRAAVKYLKDLYGIYNNWPLAIAAYNCGPGRVNKAMARSGGKTFWEIYDFLPAETRGYVPAFIGASYGYAYHKLHNIEATEPPMPLATDTLHVTRLLHMGQVASTLEGVSIETLRLLNPQYRIDILPATTKSYALRLPQHAVANYIASEEAIHAKDSAYLKQYLNPDNLEKQRAQASGTITHKVKRGETLGLIARKYGVSQQNIMRWNGIKNPNRLSEGQRLKIIRNR